jgi:hypothetical protein
MFLAVRKVLLSVKPYQCSLVISFLLYLIETHKWLHDHGDCSPGLSDAELSWELALDLFISKRLAFDL